MLLEHANAAQQAEREFRHVMAPMTVRLCVLIDALQPIQQWHEEIFSKACNKLHIRLNLFV